MKLRIYITGAMVLFYLPLMVGQEQGEATALDIVLADEVAAITEPAVAPDGAESEDTVDEMEIEDLAIGLTDKQRKLASGLLHVLLSTEFVIYSKTLNFHWNVVGPLFGPLHAFFEKLYKKQFKTIDLLAERIRALGFPVNASLTAYLRYSKVLDQTTRIINEKVMLAGLFEDYKKVITYYRDAIKALTDAEDAGTTNLLEELLVQHEKIAWILRAYLGEGR